MKTINFRPLRLLKKSNKIVVASYEQWNKLRCANYAEFTLNIINEYDKMDKNELVHNHLGERLYHFNINPWEVYEYHKRTLHEVFSYDDLRGMHKDFITVYEDGYRFYSIRGTDVAGTPTFSHLTETRITTDDTWNHYGGDAFEPITVGYVITWLGWFLYQLENSKIKVL